MTTQLGLDTIDLTDPELFRQGFPHDVFAILRDEAPVWWHPVAVSQPSSVQSLPSSQLVGPPGRHWPPRHTSFDVQASPSSHGAVLFV